MKRKQEKDNSLIGWIKTVIISLMFAFIISNFIILNANIPTGSMLNTIEINDRVFANRLSYIITEAKRGDIVVFEDNDETSKLLVKRIMALPNETIEIKNGNVLINGEVINDYTDIITNGEFGPFLVPEDHYFMLGDNRNNSHDSRFWNNKYISIKSIKGKVFLRYFPSIKIF